MTTEVPCSGVNRETATEGQGEARRKFRAPGASQFIYRILGQFSGHGVDSSNRPLPKARLGSVFLASVWCLSGSQKDA
jgi:hypothetical protein